MPSRDLETFTYLKSKSLGDTIRIQLSGCPKEEVELVRRGRQHARVKRPSGEAFLVEFCDVIMKEEGSSPPSAE